MCIAFLSPSLYAQLARSNTLRPARARTRAQGLARKPLQGQRTTPGSCFRSCLHSAHCAFTTTRRLAHPGAQQPSNQPTTQPTTQPRNQATTQPSKHPTTQPTNNLANNLLNNLVPSRQPKQPSTHQRRAGRTASRLPISSIALYWATTLLSTSLAIEGSTLPTKLYCTCQTSPLDTLSACEHSTQHTTAPPAISESERFQSQRPASRYGTAHAGVQGMRAAWASRGARAIGL